MNSHNSLSRRARKFVGLALTGTLVGAGLAVASTAAPAGAAPPGLGPAFDCTTPLVFVSQGRPVGDPLNPGGYKGTMLLGQQYTDTGGQFSVIGSYPSTRTPIDYNGIAVNPSNRYIYGQENGNQTNPEPRALLVIDANGNTFPIGVPTVNGTPVSSNHGAFDPAGNFYFGSGDTIYEIQANQIIAATNAGNPNRVIPVVQLTGTGVAEGGSDWTYADGNLWSAGPDGDVWRVDLATLVETDYPNVVSPILNSPTMDAYGAAWTYGNGTLGFDANAGDTGPNSLTIQTVDISDPNHPVRTRQTSGPSSGNNDGASCSEPADLAITKTVNGQTGSAGAPVSVQPSGNVTWQLGVNNAGPGGSSQQFVTDAVPAGVTNLAVNAPGASCTAVAAGASFTCTFGYLPAGGTRSITITGTAPPGVDTEFDNTATVSGNEADPTPGNNSATAYARTPGASFTMTKSGVDTRTGTASGAVVGDTVNYSFVVTNTGGTTLSGLAISDAKVGPVACPASPVPPQAAVTCTASYTVTQGDVDAGIVHNVASATMTAPDGSAVGPVTSAFDVTTVAPASALSLAKTVVDTTTNSTSGGRVGHTAHYTFVVTNTGNVSLSAVTVTDPMFPAGIACNLSGPLAPNAAVTCTPQDHAITQADFDAGSLTNTATANGTPVAGPAPAPSQSSATLTMADAAPAISLTKTAVDTTTHTASGADVGHEIDYTLTATNTGDVTENIAVTDPMFPGLSCAQNAVAPGGTVVCAPTHTVSQGDVDAGVIHNTATATGTPVRGAPVTATASADVTAVAAASALALTKTAVDTTTGTATGGLPGHHVQYGFAVQNTGNVSLSGVTVTDPMFPGGITCTLSGPLAPQATVTCAPQDHVITQGEFDAGSLTNTATANGTPVRGDAPAPSQASATIGMAPATAGITLTKTAVIDGTNSATGADLGQQIDYTLTATNTGNVTLSTVTVTDPMFPSLACSGSGVAPGATVVCTPTHVVDQADLDAGIISNTATATGVPVRGTPNPVTATASADVTTVPAAPALVLTKTAVDTVTNTATGGLPNDPVHYTFVVQNTGNVSLSAVTVDDPMFPGAITCDVPTPLAPQATVTCTPQDHAITQAEFDAGVLTNTATANGTPVRGDDPAPSQSSATIAMADPTPGIVLTKTALDAQTNSTSDGQVGDSVHYTFVVENTGNVSLSAVTVDDPMFPGAITCDLSSGPLAPGASVTCTPQDHAITQAEFDAGTLDNTATANATPVRGDPPDPSQSSATVTMAAATPAIALAKTATDTRTKTATGAEVGDTIAYTLVATNTGNVTLTSVEVTDPMFATVTCDPLPATGLAPGASDACSVADYKVVQSDVDAGSIKNTATATGVPARGTPNPVTGTAEATVKTVAAAPAITLVKTAHVTPAADQQHVKAGDHISYTFLITNTGNVTLKNVHVDDPTAGAVTCPTGTLAPGEHETCRTAHDRIVTAADVSGGQALVNKATAYGDPPQGLPRVHSATATASVAVAAVPAAVQALAYTGSPVLPLVVGGGLAILVGLLLLTLIRRRPEGDR